MEEQMDELRSCLMERLGLSKERDILASKEREIICPRMYAVCFARLEIISSRLHYLECQIKQMTTKFLVTPTFNDTSSIPNNQPSSPNTDE